MKVPAHRTSKHRSGIGRQTGLCVTRLLMGTMRHLLTFSGRRNDVRQNLPAFSEPTLPVRFRSSRTISSFEMKTRNILCE